MNIGAMVQYHRKRAKLSRAKLALLSGVGKTSIYDIEHGKLSIRLSTLLKILDTLNIAMKFDGPLVKEFEANEES